MTDALVRPRSAAIGPAPADQLALRWLERLERGFAIAKEVVEGPHFVDPAEIARHLKLMVDAAKQADCFIREDIRALTRRAEEIERTAYERFLDHVLELARTAARREGGLELPPLLKAINEIVAQLRRLGIDAEASERLKTKLGILRDTSAAGKSAKAKNFKLTGPTQSYKGDHRLYVRYRDPALHIVLHGRRYQTVDWSLGGLLIGEVESLFAPIGTLIELRIGIEESQMHAERATIVRFSANRHELALQFRRFGSAMINIKRECEALGLTPR